MGITSRSPTSPSSSRATMLLITVAWFGVYAEQRQMTATLTLTAPWATQYRTAPLSLDLHREIAGVEASMLVCSFVVVALLVPFVNHAVCKVETSVTNVALARGNAAPRINIARQDEAIPATQSAPSPPRPLIRLFRPLVLLLALSEMELNQPPDPVPCIEHTTPTNFVPCMEYKTPPDPLAYSGVYNYPPDPMAYMRSTTLLGSMACMGTSTLPDSVAQPMYPLASKTCTMYGSIYY
ncbi:hypothetical protein PHYSODRAFT_340583 [Phytophthora sojae]|uniref:Uncharacterized protein n=1 Tax=Phytophthora sojae (strain P6497) TaxID=1094619 RepID=G5AA70_PHYSP|nr:hypothetical protein PHYSODRAFT_340583 [Phytophthora sojae]EGZ07499.1 hypothetical protein PHYSODRAFT_340583 [Phytophthora sojae]|eukprot:XP_009537065.1 hypothetical protein PHYSODRAFT_340583 [Phytophthora sojae]